MIRLITIDCWGTIFKNQQEWDASFFRIAKRSFSSLDPTITDENIKTAFRLENDQFSNVLKNEMVTLSAAQRLRNLGRCTGIHLTEEEVANLKLSFDAAIVSPLPALMPGAAGFLSQIRTAGAKLALISNTGWFSSVAITSALRSHELDSLFDFLAFSDELGIAKPSSKLFEKVLAATNSQPNETVHIGDKIDTDVMGALNSGLYLAVHFHAGGKCLNSNYFCFAGYREIWQFLSAQIGDQSRRQ